MNDLDLWLDRQERAMRHWRNEAVTAIPADPDLIERIDAELGWLAKAREHAPRRASAPPGRAMTTGPSNA
jgi:hypothetical protein